MALQAVQPRVKYTNQ